MQAMKYRDELQARGFLDSQVEAALQAGIDYIRRGNSFSVAARGAANFLAAHAYSTGKYYTDQEIESFLLGPLGFLLGLKRAGAGGAGGGGGGGDGGGGRRGGRRGGIESEGLLSGCWTLHFVDESEAILMIDCDTLAFWQPDQPLEHLRGFVIAIDPFEVKYTDGCWWCNPSFKLLFDNVVYFGGSNSSVGSPYTPDHHVVADTDYSSIGAAVSSLRAAFSAYCHTYPVLKLMKLPRELDEGEQDDNNNKAFLMNAFLMTFVMTNGTTNEAHIAAALQLLLQLPHFHKSGWKDDMVAVECGTHRMSKVCAAAAKLLVDWATLSKISKISVDAHPVRAATPKLLGDSGAAVHDEAGGVVAEDVVAATTQGVRDVLQDFNFVVEPVPPEASAKEAQFAVEAQMRIDTALDRPFFADT